MTTRRELSRRILLVLRQLAGQPMEHDILVDSVTIRFQPRPTRSDVEEAIRDLEASDHLTSTEMELQGVVHALTAKGTSAAQQLR
jgi:ribonuclease HI